MSKKIKILSAIIVVLIAGGTVFFLSGSDLMGRMEFNLQGNVDPGPSPVSEESHGEKNL
ncbi:hypothetical protein HOG17_00185 [Candidatus Peregrinibacteria bacterium]|jgi:hypothetical protein|nr:hypothetical protein [Candidatus Peregrinibacteria bacterium]MBT4147679.1 hypothetical protein [Candidatus Peregrinibacteria bacterium]MBT4365958.1 hypothetical protein [Candidatus Peregrinibacteria bacterium]MBT4455807.1 hypothetical protein [Candidatus Peregrinibacteria bacterium]